MALSAALSALHSLTPAQPSPDGRPLGGARSTARAGSTVRQPLATPYTAEGKTYKSKADFDKFAAERDATRRADDADARAAKRAITMRDIAAGGGGAHGGGAVSVDASREAELNRQHELAMLREREAMNARAQPSPAEIEEIVSRMPPPGVVSGGGGSATPGAGEEAAFARAKDRIGLIGGGALKSLRASMDARGISGGGAEAAATGALVGDTAGDLGEVSRDIAIEGARRSQEIDDRNYEGRLRQRDQDISVWNARQQMLMNLMRQRPLY